MESRGYSIRTINAATDKARTVPRHVELRRVNRRQADKRPGEVEFDMEEAIALREAQLLVSTLKPPWPVLVLTYDPRLPVMQQPSAMSA